MPGDGRRHNCDVSAGPQIPRSDRPDPPFIAAIGEMLQQERNPHGPRHSLASAPELYQTHRAPSLSNHETLLGGIIHVTPRLNHRTRAHGQ
ncbi:hypothetical protein GDO81_030164 [Engystomops pustulosus]|uniref:Uncharacterized protein n=1 Tax=Engystomops pustulosus TaxID=76066 RepID=A0AAV6YGU8_ENGPU|nr:hypothetical protein GDO81_030164 [Engystomops pustulosus]KAG8534836.1 hypothetical protein GDO81_030164 [Engystomops pustulosus]